MYVLVGGDGACRLYGSAAEANEYHPLCGRFLEVCVQEPVREREGALGEVGGEVFSGPAPVAARNKSTSLWADLHDEENAYLKIEPQSTGRSWAAILLFIVLAAVIIVVIKKRSKS